MDSRKKRRVGLRVGLAFVLFFVMIFLIKQTVGLAAINKSASPTHTKNSVSVGTVSDDVMIWSGPGEGFDKVGILKDKTKVSVYSTKNGWAQLLYQKKKVYIPAQSVRFYSGFSAAEAQKITDKVIGMQRATWDKNQTKAQIFSAMSEGYTTDYISKYFKQLFRPAGTDASGTPLYHIVETEIYGYAIDRFDWAHANDPEPPTVIHYVQDGKEYLVVSQYHLNEESGNHLSTLSLYKSSPSANWKVYDYHTSYLDSVR
jgi:hypothetical protein